ncbi:sodium/alanine symporter [Vibrio astriarenae]|nr:sodium/alanine symporter [Vibrio sp. C7]
MFSVLRNSRKADNAGISSFQALCTSLAARVGTGNMAGVALRLLWVVRVQSSGCG